MLAKIMLISTIIFAPLFFSFAQPSYVGVKICVMCHKSDKAGQQKSIWENSKHSKAFETLLTEEADAIEKKNVFGN